MSNEKRNCMTKKDKLELRLSEVIQRNVKDEELRTCFYLYLTCEVTSVCETEKALVNSHCFSEFKLEESEIIVAIILDNIADDMEHYSDYLSSVMRKKIEMLQANIHGSILYHSKRKYAGVAEIGLWDLKEKI